MESLQPVKGGKSIFVTCEIFYSFYLLLLKFFLFAASDESSPNKELKLDNVCKDPKGHPTEEELQSLASDIIENWKTIGRRLGIQNREIMKIHKDHINYEDITEKSFAMLLAWKEKKGTLATYGGLRDVLVSSGLVHTAQKHFLTS